MAKISIPASNVAEAINRTLERPALVNKKNLINIQFGPKFIPTENVKFDVLPCEDNVKESVSVLALFTRSGEFSAEVHGDAIAEFLAELFE